ncbi:MAG: hypothetical protein GY947_15440, partial [Rhodobacteraceae bacterium]|nr:hypothetical protein [Paracoccaceae bacterium]
IVMGGPAGLTPEDGHLDLGQTFADQASITIHNARQVRDVPKRLAREEATREILEVISQHPEDEQPVFDAIMNLAAKLCNAPASVLFLRNPEDTHLITVAAKTDSAELVEQMRQNPHRLDDTTSLTVEAVTSKQVRFYPDMTDLSAFDNLSEQHAASLKHSEMRTLLYVPLIQGDRA